MRIGKLIGEGRSAEIFELEDNKVVKLFRKDMPKKGIENEYNVAKEVYNQGVITPKPYELVEVDNRYGIIYERVDGVTMLKFALSKPWLIGSQGRRLAEIHKEMQVESDLEFIEFKDMLKDRIKWVKALDDNDKKIIYNYIDTLEDGNCVCHGDFHPDNIILSKGKVVIIDWMTGCKGSCLAYVARTAVILKFAELPEDKSSIERKIGRMVINKFYKEYLKRYIEISGVKVKEIEKWQLPIAAARLIEGGSKKENENLLKFIKEEIKKLK